MLFLAHPAVEIEGEVAALVATEAELSWVGERSPPLPIGAEAWWTLVDCRAMLLTCILTLHLVSVMFISRQPLVYL